MKVKLQYIRAISMINDHTPSATPFDVTTSYNSVDRAAWLGKVTSQRHACRTGNKMAA
jgi:hypothetical protein